MLPESGSDQQNLGRVRRFLRRGIAVQEGQRIGPDFAQAGYAAQRIGGDVARDFTGQALIAPSGAKYTACP